MTADIPIISDFSVNFKTDSQERERERESRAFNEQYMKNYKLNSITITLYLTNSASATCPRTPMK